MLAMISDARNLIERFFNYLAFVKLASIHIWRRAKEPVP
jgi:hypothetical protein